jgi:hypothetical protein
MVKIYADVLILGSVYVDREESPEYIEQLDSVLTYHGVSHETFNTSLSYYSEDPHRWKDLIDRVILELESRRDQELESPIERSSS